MRLTEQEIAKAFALANDCYPYFTPELRVHFNNQLAEAKYRWEYDDWCERLVLTRDFYEGKQAHGLGGPVKTKRKKPR